MIHLLLSFYYFYSRLIGARWAITASDRLVSSLPKVCTG
jgi:hypothetical protein